MHRIFGSLAAQSSLAAGIGALLVLSACSSAEHPATSGPVNGASAGNSSTNLNVGDGSNGKAGSNGDGNGSGIIGDGCDVKTNDEVCAAQAYEGEAVPLDIYIMFDQSGSMLNDVGGITRLDAIERAAGTFLRDQASSAIGVGVGYFGYQPIGQTTCGASDYATPSVTVTLDHEAILGSLAQREPTGETPTGAAIRGACSYAQGWKKANPGRQVVMLLLTDGEPKAPQSCSTGGCCPTLADAVQATTDCRNGKPGIKTYVLGVGPFLDNLQQIAQAGGTEHAYLIGDQDVEQKVLQALNTIRGDASIPCTLKIPEPAGGTELNYGLVNVAYQDSNCAISTIYNVPSAASCDASGGWYYDNPTAPSTVNLCGASCDLVSAPGGRLAFTVGCQTKTIVK